MKNLLILIFSLMIFCSSNSVEAAKKAVAIMPLENISNYSAMNVPEIMAEKLTAALQNSGKYFVVERERMSEILREQGFQNISSNSAVEIGQLTGSNYSVFGKITFISAEKNLFSRILPKSSEKGVINGWKARVEIDIRFVNNETGELVLAENIVGTKTGINETDAINSACKEAAENFFNKLMATAVGRIVDFQGNDIYIDQGLESGFRRGDILNVLRETSPIEVNGKIIGMKTIPIGKIKIAEIYGEYAICKVVSLQTGQKLQKNDVIRKG